MNIIRVASCALILLAAGCPEESEGPGPIGPIPPIEGALITTKLGVRLHVAPTIDPAKAAIQIDQAVEWWIAFWMGREAGWQRAVLLARAQLLPIVLYDATEVANRAGFKCDTHIGIAYRGGFYCVYFGRQLDGADIAIHELSHVLKPKWVCE